jgi:hypothetical protein
VRRKPLNRNVREGLRELAALVSAGSSADILGYDEDQLNAEGRKRWEQVLAACAWVRDLPEDPE